jgi:hypothetical protein
MPGRSSWTPHAPQGVKGLYDDDDAHKWADTAELMGTFLQIFAKQMYFYVSTLRQPHRTINQEVLITAKKQSDTEM